MTPDLFRSATGLSASLAEKWAPIYTLAMAGYGIDTPLRQASFLAQAGHESAGFTAARESFNYSVAGLQATFGKRLSSMQCAALGRQPGESSVPLARQIQIANIVYGGRMGNVSANDGWRYRGGGHIQITGRDNYADAATDTGLDLSDNPDLIADPTACAVTACWYWQSNGCNTMADRYEFTRISKLINVGNPDSTVTPNGNAERLARWKAARAALGV
ncbi:glycoside hydrolase family 19 protein [Chitinasiproducens palmae]|uniref:Putative chitinase n=1 Tax=Chitinasiproducens palmae TaxID=1770053 RepID=A0A1H2PSB3_9BURK|nr:glycoside hydrolase family 19 protein [Chitinasiproducens palmae]SDV49838.1 putative chitinase [Chitinasiproducens palmae]